MTRTTAYGVYDGNLVCAWERRPPAPDALWRIRPQRIVVAAGAIEQPSSGSFPFLISSCDT